jgi:hypothetical protein
MYLHKLGTLNRSKLEKIFSLDDGLSLDNAPLETTTLYEALIRDLMHKNLGMDDNSINWMKALTMISKGDIDGFDYLG